MCFPYFALKNKVVCQAMLPFHEKNASLYTGYNQRPPSPSRWKSVVAADTAVQLLKKEEADSVAAPLPNSAEQAVESNQRETLRRSPCFQFIIYLCLHRTLVFLLHV